MTLEAQCIAIAQACGWTTHECQNGQVEWRNPDGGFVGRYQRGYCPSDVPYYTSDLNAMHDAEKVIGPIKGIEFCYHLNEMGMSGEWEILTATAAQRAEAFLRTLNLWRDDA